MGSRPGERRRAGPPTRVDLASPTYADAAYWLLFVALGLFITAVAVAADAPLGTSAAPFTGEYRLQIGVASGLAPVVAVLVLTAWRVGLGQRLPWRWLLLAGYLGGLGWALALALIDGGAGLADPITRPDSYFADLPAVRADPDGFLRAYVDNSTQLAPATRQHPPGPVLLLFALYELGVTAPLALGLVVTALGCLTVPVVAVAVRSLCGESTARRLLPVLVLAPFALWLAVSLAAVTAAICAAAVAAGVLASEHRRTGLSAGGWALTAGVLLGVGALFSYAAPWLGVSIIVTYFVRRRALLNLISGAGALLPLLLAQALGFSWTDGLTAAQTDFSIRVEPHRSWLLWGVLDLLLLALAAGPALASSVRKVRRTAGWPFLVGAGLAVGFAVVSGLARGEVERSWLPFFPWLLVAAVAPEPRLPPAGPTAGHPAVDRVDADSSPTPLPLVALGAVTAVVIAAGVRTPW